MTDAKQHRTTIVLSAEDRQRLRQLSDLQGGISEVEAIRRAIRLAAELMTFQKMENGAVVLEKGRSRERIRFL
jgi:hypothetical protein